MFKRIILKSNVLLPYFISRIWVVVNETCRNDTERPRENSDISTHLVLRDATLASSWRKVDFGRSWILTGVHHPAKDHNRGIGANEDLPMMNWYAFNVCCPNA